MFGIEKDRLEKNLDLLQKNSCSYFGAPNQCDCKYNKTEEVIPMSESSCGCPELRLVVKLVNAMTESEYKELCKRAGITL